VQQNPWTQEQKPYTPGKTLYEPPQGTEGTKRVRPPEWSKREWNTYRRWLRKTTPGTNAYKRQERIRKEQENQLNNQNKTDTGDA
jgi:hypothetical protein